MKKRVIVLTAVIAAIAAVCPFVCSTVLSESYYTYKSDKVTRDVKLAFVSDVHNSRYGKDMREIVDAVDDFKPDAVVFGGDLFDGYSYDYEVNSLCLVRRLAEKYPCVYAVGNHEGYIKDFRNTTEKKVRELGVNVLRGDSFDLDGGVRLIGMDSIFSAQGYRAKEAAADDMFNVLVYHYPEDIKELSAYGCELVLSGHAHGGQVRIPFIEQGIYSPGQGLFPKYTSGVYTENGTDMIVSRGLCRELPFSVIPRVFNRPEIVFITIEQE